MRAIASKLKRKLRKSDTAERCGLVLTDGTVAEVANIHQDPEQGFRIAAAEMLKHEAALAGTWHTHPGETANLSHEDYAGFSQWPELTHYIIGTDGIRAYRFDDGLIVEIDLAG